MRFVTVLAALDTGSAFEGMGASREVQFAALAEPALLLGLAVLVRSTGSLSLSGAFAALTPAAWAHQGAALVLVLGTLFVVFLAENARIPVDDPNTHLELTMIHEVMVLDHGGPDLGLIHYGAALKLWVLGALLVGVALPVQGLATWAGLARLARGNARAGGAGGRRRDDDGAAQAGARAATARGRDGAVGAGAGAGDAGVRGAEAARTAVNRTLAWREHRADVAGGGTRR